MDLSVMLPTKANSWQIARRAEELGCSHAWFFDTPLLNAEIFVAMGAAALKTSRIKLGTGVLIPSNRLAAVAASGLATLNALAPGRIVFGVSTGFTGRRTLGLGPIKLATLETYIDVVEGLLNGETVEWSEDASSHKIRFLNPELGLVNIADPIETFLSALGPKGRRIVAKRGAGWINGGGSLERLGAEITDMKVVWQEQGRDLADLYAVASASGCVLKDGEPVDSPRAIAQAGPGAAIVFHNLVEEEEFGSIVPASGKFPFQNELDAYREVYKRYTPADARYLSNHRGHLMFVRPDETHITANVLRGLTMTATKSEIVERIRGIKQLGYRQIRVTLAPDHEEDILQSWSDVMAAV